MRRCSECGVMILGRRDKVTCSARCRVTRSRRLYRGKCVCGHAYSSHRPNPSGDPWVEKPCKTCGCATFDDGRPSDPDSDYDTEAGPTEQQIKDSRWHEINEPRNGRSE